MLRLLLDEHVSPAVADGLRRRHKGVAVVALRDWQGGNFLGQEDAVLLREAARQGLTLVTYDRRTIPPLLKAWMEEGQAHGGVIFVDGKTISPADVGGLVKALGQVVSETGQDEWLNAVLFVRR